MKPERSTPHALILLFEPLLEVDAWSLSVELLLFFDLLFELDSSLALAWSEDDVLGVDDVELVELGLEEPLFIDELPFIEPLVPELVVPDALVSDEDDAAPLYFDDEPDDGL